MTFLDVRREEKVSVNESNDTNKIVSMTPFNKLNITKIVKRNGEVVDFDIEKIQLYLLMK